MNQEYKYDVSVILVTYNQEMWIQQAIESVLQQETQYTFELIIGDDCSSDNTPYICKRYADSFPNIVLLKRGKNMGCVPNWIDCAKHAQGKYFMMLDGDDFWHNPHKIQIQVDYMEKNPSCVLCHTDFNRLNEFTGHIVENIKKKSNFIPLNGSIQKEIFQGIVSIASNSTCFRSVVFREHVPTEKYIELGFLGIDYPTWIFLSGYGDVNYLPISTYTYRVGQGSLTNNTDYGWVKHRCDIEKKQVIFLSNVFPNLRSDHIDKYYDKLCSHQLLLAAYNNMDYCSARFYARHDKMPNWKTVMAYTWLTFQLVCLWLYYKKNVPVNARRLYSYI